MSAEHRVNARLAAMLAQVNNEIDAADTLCHELGTGPDQARLADARNALSKAASAIGRARNRRTMAQQMFNDLEKQQ